jgi:hypothetical protein
MPFLELPKIAEKYTVSKMDLILRSIQRRPQMQFSIGRRFTLWN